MFADLLRRQAPTSEPERRSWWPPLLPSFSFAGNGYSTAGTSDVAAGEVANNSVVGACVSFRSMVFSEARLKFQGYRDGRPGELFGTPALRPLEQPWPGGSTGDLLSLMEVDASIHGNSYWIRQGSELVRLPADRVLVVTGTKALGANAYAYELLGYFVTPHKVQQWSIDTPVDINNDGGVFFMPNDVCHYMPLPDPNHQFRGRSWISSVLPDSLADNELTRYKHAFIENAAMPNMGVIYPPQWSSEEIERFKAVIDARYTGVDKAFKTMHFGGGVDIKMMGASFEQLAMHATQGGGETRIAVAAGVPATILGISEGLKGSSLNAGNYMASRRRFADGTLRPLWRMACAALSTIVDVPAGARLWYDDRDISFLQEDVLDEAKIRQQHATTIRTLIDGGFDPDSVVAAVTTGDMTRLEHTGNVSVQLRPVDADGTPSVKTQSQLEAASARSEERQSFVFNFPEQRFDVSVPEQPATVVHVDGPVVNVPEQRMEPTIVNVSPTPVTVENTVNVEPTPVSVDVRNEVETPVVNVNATAAPPTVNVQIPDRKSSHRVRRDSAGRIAEVVED